MTEPAIDRSPGPLADDLSGLRRDLATQGRDVVAVVSRAIDAVFERDVDKAKRVIMDDDVVDSRDVRIERDAVALLNRAMDQCAASGKPMLSPYEIRTVLTVVKVNNEFERIADLAVSVASKIDSFTSAEQPPPPRFRVMANSVLGILDHTVTALDEMDVAEARLVLASEDATEAFREAILRENEELLSQGGPDVGVTPDFAFALNRIAAALARIADHCTNVAEQVIYVETGKIVRHLGERWSDPTDPELTD
jgi:phosphate transport system protein